MCHFQSWPPAAATAMITSLKQGWTTTPCLLASDKPQELLGVWAYTTWKRYGGCPLIPLQRQFRGTFHKVPQISQAQALVLCCFQLNASLTGFPSICFIFLSFLFPGITSPINYWTQAFVLDPPFRRTKVKAKTSCKVTLAGRKMTFKIILLLWSIYILLGECPY